MEYHNASGLDGNLTTQLIRRSGLLLNYSLTNAILVGLGLFVVILVTAFGNFLVGLSLFRYRSLRTISNYLIGNLALSDFLLAITILPLSTVNECLGHWVFGRVACNLWLITDVLYCTASIWNICIIAFDRFTATFYPMWYHDKRSAKQAALYVGVVWFIATSVSVPPVLGWNDISQNYVHHNDTNVDKCTIFQTHSYVLFSACGSFFVPFFITFALYVRIFGVVRQRMQRSRSVRSSRRRTLQSSAASVTGGAVTPQAGEYPLEKTPLCKTVTLETTVFDSPARSRASGNCAAPDDALNKEKQDGVNPSSSLRVKLCGKDRIPVTEAFDAAASERPQNGSTLAPNGRKPSYVTCSSDSGDPLTTQLSETLLSPCETDGLIILNDVELKDNSAKMRLREYPHVQRDFELIKDTDAFSSDIPDASDRTGARSRLRKATTTADVASHGHPRRESPSPRRGGRPTRTGRTLSAPTGAPRSGGARLSRKTSVVNAFRSIGSIRSLRESWTSHQQNFEQMEMKATVRMAFIIAAFCGMWLGFFTLYVLNSWCESCRIPRELDAFFFWLGYLNSTVNPILYAIFNEEFRKAFKKILGFDRRPRSGSWRQSGGASGGGGGGGRGSSGPRRK